MNVELIFSVAGIFAMLGWLLLCFTPLIPVWSQRIAGLLIPLVLSAGYVVLVLTNPPSSGGGFGSFAAVTTLFSQPQVLLAGWIHYLAFDLLIGAWECRVARREEWKFWFVLPCLLLTFMFGPAGYLLFSLLRLIKRRNKLLASG